MTLDEILDFHKNLAREKGTRFDALDKAIKNDLIKNRPEEDKTKLMHLRWMETSTHKWLKTRVFQGPQSPSNLGCDKSYGSKKKKSY